MHQAQRGLTSLNINCNLNGRSIKWRYKLLPLEKCKSVGSLLCLVAQRNRFEGRTKRFGLGGEGIKYRTATTFAVELVSFICGGMLSVAVITWDVISCSHYVGCYQLQSVYGMLSVAVITWDVISCSQYMGYYQLQSLHGMLSVAVSIWDIISCNHYMGCYQLQSLHGILSVAVITWDVISIILRNWNQGFMNSTLNFCSYIVLCSRSRKLAMGWSPNQTGLQLVD
jgi:hypothetical protein